MRNRNKFNMVNPPLLPARGDSLDNPLGYPTESELPATEDILGRYINTLYSPGDITIDWKAYKHYLSEVKPDFCPHVLFVGHDGSKYQEKPGKCG